MKKISILLLISISLFIFNFFLFEKPDSEHVEINATNGIADVTGIDFQKAGKAVVSGEWEVFDNQLLSPEDIRDGDVSASALENTMIPGQDRENHYLTVRMVINAADYKSYKIKLFPSNSNFRLWINGGNVYGTQLNDKDLLNDSKIRTVDIDSAYFSWDCTSITGEIEVLMQLSSNSFHNGIYTSIQESSSAQRLREIRLVVFSVFVGGILMIGVFFVNYYINNRKNKVVLYLSFMCAATSIQIALNYLDYSIGQAFGIRFSYEMLKYFRRIPEAAILVTGAMFINQLYEKDALKHVYRFLNVLLFLWVFAETILFAVGSYVNMLKVISYGNLVVLGYLIYYIVVMGRALVNRRSDAPVFLFSLIVAGIAGLHDALLGMGIINNTNILFYYGILVLILTMSTYLSKNFSSTLKALETTAEGLSKSHSELKRKNEELDGMWHQVVNSRNELARLNEDLEGIVEKRTSTIRNLFHNAGQGFLSIDKNLMVHDEYSQECERIFQCELRQSYLPDLLYKDNETEKASFRKIVDKAMETRSKREVYLSLLPSEVEIKGRHIFVEYKLISGSGIGCSNHSSSIEHADFSAKVNDNLTRFTAETEAAAAAETVAEVAVTSTSTSNTATTVEVEELMLILTDVTDKHELEKQLEAKRQSLEMIVKVIINRNDFEECIKGYRSFCSKHFFEIIASDSINEKKTAEILRFIHNLKGNFSQFGLTSLVGRLHDLEDQLINSSMFEYNIKSIKSLIDTEIMLSWLEEELDGLEKILGSEFFSKRNLIPVKMEKLIELEQIVIENLSEDKQQLLLPKLRRLRYKPLGEMLSAYESYVTRLSEQLEKGVNWGFHCEDVLVDTNRYHAFIRSLVHVYRNAMDHGMENGEERLESGKDELGTISTSLVRSNNQIILKISDDGRGLDTELIAAKAIEKGIYDKEQIKQLSENEVHRLIFNEEFSTKDHATQLSGRGVGMSAVLYEVEKLGGYVGVESESGVGTTFEFYFIEVQE
jgi:signal transduction histidine kinase